MKSKNIKLGGLAEFLEEQDILSLIRLNLYVFIGLAFVAVTGFLLVRDEGWAHFAKNGLLMIAGSLAIIFLLQKKQTALAAYASLLIYAAVLAYAAWTGAGVKGTMYSLFFLIVVGAALSMGRRAGYIAAITASLLGLGLLLADRAGLLTNTDRPAVDVVTWLTLSSGFVIAAHIVGLVLRQAERAFAKAQSELEERMRAEVEVRRLNRQLEKALGEGEHRFRRLFDVSPVAIVVTTLAEGRLIDANESFWMLSGHDPGTSLGKTTAELRKNFDPRQRQEFVNRLLEKKSIRIPDYLFIDDAGNRRSTMALYELIELEAQPIILSMFYDMTEQVEAQKALVLSEGRLRALLKSIPETIMELRRDGMILQYMPAQADFQDITGRSIEQVMPAAVAAQIMFAVERALDSGQLHIVEYQLAQGGREATFEARVTVSGNDSVMLMARDVSLHKQLEIEREHIIDELEKRNAESESLRETTVIVTSTLDIEEAVQRILQQLKRVIAYDSASVWLYKGTTTHLVGGDGIPDIPEADKHYTVDENEPDYPLWVEELPYILLDDVQEKFPQFREPPINYIHGWLGVPLRVRGKLIGIISLDSREAGRFTHEDAKLALNYANQASIAVENARLFSDLQNELSERQKLIDELDSKNSELERFTYSVSHDLKSPLFTIRGFLSFLQQDVASGNSPRVEKDVQRISDAMDVMQERLDDLLELSRAGRLTNEREAIRFNDLVAEALELVHGRITDRDIKVVVEKDLPLVYGDRRRLLELVQNLIDNAAKFMGDQQHPRIEIGQHGEENGQPVFFVRDNGMGIPPEHQGRIFGTFSKLNPSAEGTGIGLSLVKKIIEAHGGRIRVESEPVIGSTFYFSLPRVSTNDP